MHQTFPIALAGALMSLAGWMTPAAAQQPGASRPSSAQPNPVMEAAQHAFDALAEAERKAIQDDLIWASNFNATLSGSFGPRTFDAIRHFEAALKSNIDGILDDPERKALSDAAKRARAAAKFALVTDPATGAALGLPLAVFTKRETLPIGSIWASKDDAISIRTGASPGSAADLPRAFEGTLSIQAPGRKVTYKLLRPDFFVVSGEVGPRTFYTRTAMGKTQLVSYTLMYPTARAKEFERVLIALANSYQPIGGQPIAVAATSGSTSAPHAAPLPAAGTLPPGLMLTGIVVAPNRIATDALATACPDLRINQKPARISGAAQGGVVLIDADTGKAPVVPLANVAAWPETSVMLGFAPARPVPTLNVAAATLVPAGKAGVPPRLIVPLHAEGGGSAVFDRSGNLVALVRAPHQTPRLVAGMVPTATHPVTPAETLRKLVGASGAAALTAPLSAGDMAAKFGPSLVAIECGQPVVLPKH